jgi:SAM-dependent methyltransferase
MSLTRHQGGILERPRSGRRLSTVADAAADPHVNGQYLKTNPTWHVEFSEAKAHDIHRLLQRRNLHPQSIGEVGCGAGEVLRQLQLRLPPQCTFRGYDIAPPAIAMAESRANDRLQCELADFGEIETPHFDLLLVLEVVDHIEDYLGFLRMLKGRAEWKIFSFSLDISVQNAVRKGALLRRRRDHCHLHHFSSETALASLEHTGYEVLEYSFRPAVAMTPLAKLAKPFRRMAFLLGQEFTLRMFGGFSLLVLAR